MESHSQSYKASASTAAGGAVSVRSGLSPVLPTIASPSLGQPGEHWSPEGLLCAAVAGCFALTFRSLAYEAHYPWHSMECEVTGCTERMDNGPRFVRLSTTARLRVTRDTDPLQGIRLLEQANDNCLVAQSLCAARTLQAEVVTEPAVNPVST